MEKNESNNNVESTVIYNEKTGKASLVLKTKAATMVEDMHKAFEEMQRMAGIKEEGKND